MGSGRGRSARFVRDCQLSESGQPDSGDCSIQYRSPSWAPGGGRLAFDTGAAIRPGELRRQWLPQARPRHPDDAEPAYATTGRSLAFSGRSGSSRDLYVRPTSGGRAWRIARRAASPDWSRRNRIAFVRGGGIYSVAARGGRAKPITRGNSPSWSPSGRSIAFARRGGIFVTRADGSATRRVVRCSGCRTPAFSPDGRLLVYKRNGLVVARANDGKRVADDHRGCTRRL